MWRDWYGGADNIFSSTSDDIDLPDSRCLFSRHDPSAVSYKLTLIRLITFNKIWNDGRILWSE